MQDDKINQKMQDAADMQVLDNAEVLRRFKSIESRMGIVEDELVSNTKITSELRDEMRNTIGKDLREIVEIFATLKGGVKVLGWLGSAVKWASGFGAIGAAIYAVVQNIKGVK